MYDMDYPFRIIQITKSSGFFHNKLFIEIHNVQSQEIHASPLNAKVEVKLSFGGKVGLACLGFPETI